MSHCFRPSRPPEGLAPSKVTSRFVFRLSAGTPLDRRQCSFPAFSRDTPGSQAMQFSGFQPGHPWITGSAVFRLSAGTPLDHRQCSFRLPVIGAACHARRTQKRTPASGRLFLKSYYALYTGIMPTGNTINNFSMSIWAGNRICGCCSSHYIVGT